MILLALVSTLLEILGDYLFKLSYPVIGLVSYLLGIAPWFFILKEAELSRAIVIFTSLNVVGCVLVGRFLLGEVISVQQYIGILFCLIGIFFVG